MSEDRYEEYKYSPGSLYLYNPGPHGLPPLKRKNFTSLIWTRPQNHTELLTKYFTPVILIAHMSPCLFA